MRQSLLGKMNIARKFFSFKACLQRTQRVSHVDEWTKMTKTGEIIVTASSFKSWNCFERQNKSLKLSKPDFSNFVNFLAPIDFPTWLHLVSQLLSTLTWTVISILGTSARVHCRQLSVQDESEPAVGAVWKFKGGGIWPDVKAIATSADAPVVPVISFSGKDFLRVFLWLCWCWWRR